MTCSSSRYAPVQRQALSRRRSSEPCALRGALARCEAALWDHKSECVAAKLVRVSEGRLRGARGGRYAPKARDAPRASRRSALAAASACFGDHRLVLRHASVRWKLSCAEGAASVAPCLRGARRRANFPLCRSETCARFRRMQPCAAYALLSAPHDGIRPCTFILGGRGRSSAHITPQGARVRFEGETRARGEKTHLHRAAAPYAATATYLPLHSAPHACHPALERLTPSTPPGRHGVAPL